MVKKSRTILILSQIGLILLISVLQNIDTFVIGTDNHTINFSQHFEIHEYTDGVNNQTNVNSISIDLPSSSWNVTEIELNFTNIKLGRETVIIEDGGESFKTVSKDKHCWAVQINITEPTTIFAVDIYGYMENPQDEQIFIHINGYTNDRPNSTVYGAPVLLNISTTPNWYKQTFSSPISLTSGYYYLVMNGTEIGNDKKPKYYWYNNEINPTYTNLYICEYDGSWGSESQDKCLRYKIDLRVDRDYNPEEINMTAEINGIWYNISDAPSIGAGNLTVKDINYSPLESTLDIPIKINRSIDLKFNINYSISLQNKFFSNGYVSIEEDSDNVWTILPSIVRCLSNYSVKFTAPNGWSNIRVYRNSEDVSLEVLQNGNTYTIPNGSITIGSSWKIIAKSPNEDFSLDISVIEFEPNQEIKFSVDPPKAEGNLTFKLIDALDLEEFSEVKEIEPGDPETIFSYTLSESPHEGTWKIYIYWNTGTEAGVQLQEVSVIVPFTIDPEVLFIIILLIIIASVSGISAYTIIKKVKRSHREYREKIFNIYMDTLNLNHIIITEKKTGLDVYEQRFGGKDIDATLISGFLDAIRSFGIELTASGDHSQTIKLDYKESKIIMSEFKQFRIILIMSETPSALFLKSTDNLSHDIESQFGPLLEKFRGNKDMFAGTRELLEKNLQISLIYPLKVVKQEKVKISAEEKGIINRALKSMKGKEKEHFFVTTILSQKKGFQAKDAELILKLINKKIFQPIYL